MKRKLLIAIVTLLTVGCRGGEDHSSLRDNSDYLRNIVFTSTVNESDRALVLFGHYGSNTNAGRYYFGKSNPGYFVFGPYKSVKNAKRGKLIGSMEIEAKALKHRPIQIGQICIGEDACPMYMYGDASFLVDFIYRKKAQTVPTVIHSQRISVSGPLSRRTIPMGEIAFEGDANDIEIRVAGISADELLELTVFNTRITVLWDPIGA